MCTIYLLLCKRHIFVFSVFVPATVRHRAEEGIMVYVANLAQRLKLDQLSLVTLESTFEYFFAVWTLLGVFFLLGRLRSRGRLGRNLIILGMAGGLRDGRLFIFIRITIQGQFPLPRNLCIRGRFIIGALPIACSHPGCRHFRLIQRPL